MPARIIPERYSSFAFETITVSDSAKSLTAATYRPAGGGDAQYALLTPDGADLRYQMAGGTATATVGHLRLNSTDIVLTTREIALFSGIRDAAVDVNLSVTYYR